MDEAKKPKRAKKARKPRPAPEARATPPQTTLAARYWNEVVSISSDAAGHKLGSGGLFVATAEAPPVGTLLDFEISVGGEPPIGGVVEVVAARPPAEATDALAAGMRVKFVHVEDEAHARDVLGRMAIARSASMPPPPDEAEDAPPSSRRSDVWDHAVALEADFFDRASREPSFVPDDAAADAMAVRLADPAFIERQQRLRRTFGAVVAVFAVLFAVTAARTISARGTEVPHAATAGPPADDVTDDASPGAASEPSSSPAPSAEAAPSPAPDAPPPATAASPDASGAEAGSVPSAGVSEAAPTPSAGAGASEASSAPSPSTATAAPTRAQAPARTKERAPRGAKPPAPPAPPSPPAPPAKGGDSIYD